MRVADAIAEFLAANGIGHAFGIIGAGNVALFDAIGRLGVTKIVCCHHEQAAVMAAAFYARAREGVGVALATTGAGSANCLTGALAALMDSIPVLIITGNEPSKYLGTPCRVSGVQGFNTSRAVTEFVKRSVKAGDPIFTPLQELNMAYNEALAHRRGPVWLDIPREIFNETL